MAEDNNRKPIGVRHRKDDLMTAIWHKRHAPSGVILSINPAVVLPSRKDSVGICDRVLCGSFWRDLIAEDVRLCSRVLPYPRDTCQRASSDADECGCPDHERFRRRGDGADGHFPAPCLPIGCGGVLMRG